MKDYVIQMNWSPYTTYYLNKSTKPGNRQHRVSQPVYFFTKDYREESACPMPNSYTAYLHVRNYPVIIKRGKMPKNEMSGEEVKRRLNEDKEKWKLVAEIEKLLKQGNMSAEQFISSL